MDPDIAAFAERQLARLCRSLPALEAETEPERSTREQDVRLLFAGLQPRDAAEVATAIRAVAGFFTWQALSAKANSSTTPADQTTRQLANARTEGRIFDVNRRALQRSHQPPAAPRAPRAAPRHEPVAEPPPDAAPAERAPPVDRYLPHDRNGAPIPPDRWELMTAKQRRATYANPRDHALRDAALEEEAAMMAEQQALDAAPGVTPAG